MSIHEYSDIFMNTNNHECLGSDRRQKSYVATSVITSDIRAEGERSGWSKTIPTIIFLRVSQPSFTTFPDEMVLRQWSWNIIKVEVGTALLDLRQLFLHLSFIRLEAGLLPYRQVSSTTPSFFTAFDIMCLVELIACEIHGAVIRAHTLCPNTRDPLACTHAMYVQRPTIALPEAIRSISTKNSFPSHYSLSVHKATSLTSSSFRLHPQLQPRHCSQELRNRYYPACCSRGHVSDPGGLESARASINSMWIFAAATVSTEGIPAGTDAIARGAIEDASKLGNGAPRARTVIAELRPDAGGAEAGAAEAQMEASKGYHDAEDPCAEGTRCWRWTRAVYSL